MTKLSILVLIGALLANSAAIAGCISDVECGVGNKCVKASGDINLSGICVTPIDQSGNRDYSYSPSKIQPQEVGGCSFDTDCGVGFSCVKRSGQLYGICVK